MHIGNLQNVGVISVELQNMMNVVHVAQNVMSSASEASNTYALTDAQLEAQTNSVDFATIQSAFDSLKAAWEATTVI